MAIFVAVPTGSALTALGECILIRSNEASWERDPQPQPAFDWVRQSRNR
jgi:hypothetical protein